MDELETAEFINSNSKSSSFNFHCLATLNDSVSEQSLMEISSFFPCAAKTKETFHLRTFGETDLHYKKFHSLGRFFIFQFAPSEISLARRATVEVPSLASEK